MKYSSYEKSEILEINQLFEAVFTESESAEEGSLIGSLVTDLVKTKSEDIFGFTAKDKEKIIGGIFFTRLIFKNPVEAFILSPVAVSTSYQGQGIGQKLINYGIEKLKTEDVELVFTYGDPDFYSKVGFQQITEDVIQAPLALSCPEGWLCQSLTSNHIEPISDKPCCVEAFKNPNYW